jgi:hypothetical protein
MSVRYRKILLGLLLPLAVNAARGQIVYTADFTNILERSGINYYEPVEQWLHVTVPPRHAFMEYDLVLQNDRNDFEVRYDIHTHRRANEDIPATVLVSRLVSHIATNDEAYDVLVTLPTDSLLLEAFNADRGVCAYFRPKVEFSEKPFGALLSLFKAGHPSIDVIILYTDQSYDPLTMFRNIRYKEE